jgi:class 3 adenylate cyclase/tetratricopeptide (TPR) repeat protein
MRCTACGAELIAGKKFCPACGAPAPTTCTRCGATLAPEFRFCPDCGQEVAGRAPAGAAVENGLARFARHMPEGLVHKLRAAQGEGERRLVTVLFCDLAGSTAIAERLDPEEYRELLDRYLEVAFREIYALEGVVNQLAGDGMMALFGAPVAHEDAPQRAVRAALAILEALEALNESLRAERGLELSARIGIHTGPVVVGAVGNDLKMDYTAVGDTTNLAARLESRASPGTILISEATSRLVHGFFAVRPTAPLVIKGKREPIVAYEVLGRSTAATPMTIAVARGLTPLVGRHEELEQLEATFRRLDRGAAQVVAVLGPAGSGKSRLLYEFRRQQAAEGTVFFEGRCSSIRQAVPYHPFMSMFRHYFDLVPGEPAAVSCEKVSRKVGVHHDRLEATYPVLFRFLCLTIGEPSPPPADELKQESFDALARLVLAESQRAPVVMAIEDLHWIDEPSRELLENLTARLAGAPVMVVVTERPDGHAAWRVRGPFTQLALRRLSNADVAAIIGAIAGGPLPGELEARLVTKAEGSPFFAEEMIRGLLEEGILVRENGTCRLTRPVDEIPVPGSVQEVLAARLDRLDADAKRVVQVAAVLGRQFERGQLVQVLDAEPIDVARALAELEERGLLHRKSALSQDEYRFGESLTQEVAYAQLLHRQRRQLHERIALLLEKSPGEGGAARSALLAHHFARSDNRRKTVEALLRAAEDAEQLPSYTAALDFYRQAWEVAEAGEVAGSDDFFRRAALQATGALCRLGAIFGAPDRIEADRAGRRGLELAQALGDTEAMARLSYFHGALMMLGDPEDLAKGLALAERGLALAQQAGLSVGAMRISQGLAINYALDGRFDLARRAIDWGLEEMDRGNHRRQLPDLYLGARWIRDSVLLLSDDLDGAVEHAVETHALAVKRPNRTVRSGTAITLAQVCFLRGDYAEARRWAEESLEIAEAIANVGALAGAGAIALASRVELGERGPAERYLAAIDRGLEAGESMQRNFRFVGNAFVAIGDTVRAERLLQTLRRSRGGGRLREAFTATSLGELLMWLHREEEAEQAFVHAITLAEAIGARSTLAAALLGAAELAAARGATDESERRLDRARAIVDEMRLGHYLGRVQALATGSVAAAVAQ